MEREQRGLPFSLSELILLPSFLHTCTNLLTGDYLTRCLRVRGGVDLLGEEQRNAGLRTQKRKQEVYALSSLDRSKEMAVNLLLMFWNLQPPVMFSPVY